MLFSGTSASENEAVDNFGDLAKLYGWPRFPQGLWVTSQKESVFGRFGNVSRETFSINPMILTPPRTSAKTRHPRF